MAQDNWGAWRGGAVTAQLGGRRQEAWSLYQNDLFIVTVVPFHCDLGRCAHVVLRLRPGPWTGGESPMSNALPTGVTWSAKQRIKDELVGPERLAVEVFPPRAELVDQADAYHLWVLPEGFQLPFGVEETHET